MAFATPLTPSTAPEKSQSTLQAVEQMFGKSLNIFNLMAHQPDVLSGIVQASMGLQHDLPGRLRELAYVLSSKINQCSYCLHYHEAAAKQAGVTEQQLAAIEDYRDSELFDDTERDVLAYAEQLTRTAAVDEAIVKRLQQTLDEKQLVTLAASVALANFTNRFNHGLDISLP